MLNSISLPFKNIYTHNTNQQKKFQCLHKWHESVKRMLGFNKLKFVYI